MFLEDVLAGALLAVAGFFLALSIASYLRSRVERLVPVIILLLVIFAKNLLVLLDALWDVLGGSLGGYYHFAVDLLLFIVLLALVKRGREG
jgi:hypothetical protein